MGRDIDASEGENTKSVKPLDDELNPAEQIQDLNPSNVESAINKLRNESLGNADRGGISEHFRSKPSSNEGVQIDKDGSISFDKNPPERAGRPESGGAGKGDRLDRAKPNDSKSEDAHGKGNDSKEPDLDGGGKGKPWDKNTPQEIRACVVQYGPNGEPLDKPEVYACTTKLKPDGTPEDPAEVRPLENQKGKGMGFPEKDQSRLPHEDRAKDDGNLGRDGRRQHGKEPRTQFEGKPLEVKPENGRQPSQAERQRAEKIYDDLKKALERK